MKQAITPTAELVPVAYAEVLLGLAEERGIRREQLLQRAGVREQVLGTPNGRLSFLDFNQLAFAALALTADEGLGLVMGQRLNVSTHGILGYAVLSSASFGQALQFALK